MIKLFRNIRKNLLANGLPAGQAGKTTNYLKYAIGEIVLVVIGILIALQINNWNEKRKEKESLNTIYNIIISDLESDLKAIPEIIKFNNDRAPLLMHIINGNLSQTDYTTNANYYYLIRGGNSISLRTKGYEQLRNFSGSDFSSDETQIKINDFYEHYSAHLEMLNSLALDDVTSNYNFWKANYSWFAEFLIKKESNGFIRYSIENMDYKNRVANYYFLNCEIISEALKEVKTEGNIVLNHLKISIK